MSHKRTRPFGFERLHEPLAEPRVFRRRMLQSAGVTALVIGVSLALGMAGYHWLGGIPGWVDCLYNASMILGGMGPVAELRTQGAKVFASLYALYSGVVLLASVGLLLSPALHRLLHRFHLDSETE